jgi:hypothetical protein
MGNLISKEFFIVGGLLSVAFVIFTYGRMGYVEMDKGLALVFLIMGLMYLARTFEVELKYRSPKFVADNLYSTANWSDTRYIGKYAIVRLGGINAFGLHFAGGDEGTAVINIDGLDRCGESIATKIMVEKAISIDELPTEIYNARDELKLTEPLWIGRLSADKLKKPEVSRMKHELDETTRQMNMLQDMLDGKMSKIESAVESSQRIVERKQGISAFLDKFKQREEPEDE